MHYNILPEWATNPVKIATERLQQDLLLIIRARPYRSVGVENSFGAFDYNALLCYVGCAHDAAVELRSFLSTVDFAPSREVMYRVTTDPGVDALGLLISESHAS